MATGYLAPLARLQFCDADGTPYAGGTVSTFAAGTDTPQATYAESTLTTSNGVTVTLDSAGRCVMYLDPAAAYKFVLKDSAGATVWTQDNVAIPAASVAPTAVAPPTGAIFAYGAAAAPTGYLLCNGAAVDRTIYAALFAIVGTTYGVGDGSTTFNVPDLRGRFALGKAASGTGSTLGGTGGALDHTHTGPSHTHTLTTSGIVGDGGSGVTDGGVGSGTGHHHTATSAAGGTGASGTGNPAYLTITYIIKT